MHLDTKLPVNMFCQVLCTIDTAMLTARTSEGEHQRCETSLDISAHMCISQLINALQEGENLAIVFEESDDGFVESGELFVGFVTSGVMRTAAVEHISSAIARLVIRDPLAVRETIDAHHQRTLAIVFREGGRTILGVGMIDIGVGCLITVGTTHGWLFYQCETGQLGEPSQQIHEIRIGEAVEFQQFAQVLNSRRDRVDEVFLLFEISSEAIGTQHL